MGQDSSFYPITSLQEYSNSMFHVSSAEIGDLWDDYFHWRDDPMDRDLRIEMIYVVRHPNNSDVPTIKANRRKMHESRRID